MNKKFLLIPVFGLLALTLTACSHDKPASTQTDEARKVQTETIEPSTEQKPVSETGSEAVSTEMVEISNYAFSPATLTVKKGSKVMFMNEDSVKHNAASLDGNFSTKLLGQGENETVTFDTVGSFDYICTPHPYMKGKIVVTE